MVKSWSAAAFGLALLTMGPPAQACRMAANRVLADVKHADVVVVGRIVNYRIIIDQAERQRRREMLKSPDLPSLTRKSFERDSGSITDYARFEVVVDRVLKGRAPRTIMVTWDNSTFAEPDAMKPAPYLIALRNPASPVPPLRGPSATVFANPEPGTLTVLQAPCAPPFLFESTSAEAAEVRRMLD